MKTTTKKGEYESKERNSHVIGINDGRWDRGSTHMRAPVPERTDRLPSVRGVPTHHAGNPSLAAVEGQREKAVDPGLSDNNGVPVRASSNRGEATKNRSDGMRYHHRAGRSGLHGLQNMQSRKPLARAGATRTSATSTASEDQQSHNGKEKTVEQRVARADLGVGHQRTRSALPRRHGVQHNVDSKAECLNQSDGLAHSPSNRLGVSLQFMALVLRAWHTTGERLLDE